MRAQIGSNEGSPGRFEAFGRADGPVLEDHDAGAAVEHPLQLGHGLVDVGEREVGRGEDPLLVVEAPVLVEPAVERAERGTRRGKVVAQRLFHADTERGEEQRAVDALLVHHLQPDVAVAVGGVGRFEVAEQLDDARAALVVPAEVLLETARLGEVAERGVRDEPVHATTDEQARLAVDLGPLHRPLGVLGFDVAGERVGRLVVVVVGVEAA